MSWQWGDETLAGLARILGERGLAGDGRLRPIPIGDGHSNLTYRIDGASRPLVLRRPPPPPFPAGSNDVKREARILSALAGSGVPVPEVYAVVDAGELLDVPFYVMGMVEGDVVTTRMPERFGQPEQARAMGFEQVDVISRLHAVDWREAGLETLGRPEGFNARHLARLSSLVRDGDGRLFDEFAPLFASLEDSCPAESGAALIHNDCRIGNLIWASDKSPRIAAVLDWELATIGDPLMDFAYVVASLPREGEARTPVQDLATACLAEGFPNASELAERYRQDTGADLANLNWFLALVNWKLAALYAYSRRKGDDPYFDDDAHVSRFLAEAAHHAGAFA
jgi:aminoglycoside phosphotransferase (APT) family kinase protein